MASSTLAPISWVNTRDGRLAPFDGDRICSSLFAATQSLGRPDAFLARELTDSLMHFLGSEFRTTIPSTAQIAELVEKVVRELGQPAIALAYARERSQPSEPRQKKPGSSGPTLDQLRAIMATKAAPISLAHRIASHCLEAYSLDSLHTPDVASAHASGLLHIYQLGNPLTLASIVAPTGPWTLSSLRQFLLEAPNSVGGSIALDSLEHGIEESSVARLEEAVEVLSNASNRLFVHLNCDLPPPWSEALSPGPLFEGSGSIPPPGRCAAALFERLLPLALSGQDIAFGWHLRDRDFDAGQIDRLFRVAHECLAGAPIAFFFDRPRRSPQLGEGLNRKSTSVLTRIGINLPVLAQQAGSREPESYLSKTRTLVRLALAAASQKREYLRRQASDRLGRGFQVERARVALIPIGLEQVTRQFHETELSAAGSALDFARKLLGGLSEAARVDGGTHGMDVCIDGILDFRLGSDQIAGVTTWDSASTPRNQMRAASSLHAAAEGGVELVRFAGVKPPSEDVLVELLRYAWGHTSLYAVKFELEGDAAIKPFFPGGLFGTP